MAKRNHMQRTYTHTPRWKREVFSPPMENQMGTPTLPTHSDISTTAYEKTYLIYEIDRSSHADSEYVHFNIPIVTNCM